MEEDELKETIKKILLNNNFCDENLLDNCTEELIELFEQIDTTINKNILISECN